MLTAATICRPRSDVRFRIVDREAVVLRQADGEALVLNEVGARLLELSDGRRSLGDAVVRLRQEFDVEPDRLFGDAQQFLAELMEIGILEPVEPEEA